MNVLIETETLNRNLCKQIVKILIQNPINSTAKKKIKFTRVFLNTKIKFSPWNRSGMEYGAKIGSIKNGCATISF